MQGRGRNPRARRPQNLPSVKSLSLHDDKLAFMFLIRTVIWAGLLVLWLGATTSASMGGNEEKDPPLVLPRYETLRDAPVSHAGQIQDGHLRLDRFGLELTDGHLYLAPTIDGTIPIAVFLGDGRLKAYPPDAVEYHQLEKLSDEHHVDERFERLVLWLTDDTAKELQALATPAREEDTDDANDLLKERREDRLKQQLDNPDSRVVAELLRREAGGRPEGRAFLLADIDTREHDWLTLIIEPTDLEEVSLYKHHARRRLVDWWMRFDHASDYEPSYTESALDGFRVDPESLDDDDITGVALGLPSRPLEPDHERWAPRLAIPRTDVDLALDDDGDANVSAALLIEPLEPTRGVRLQISPVLEVTDVRWRADTTGDNADAPLLPTIETLDDHVEKEVAPDEPVSLTGERLPFVQEKNNRFFEDDQFEPWVTIELPHIVQPGERFILAIAYEGELVERLRQTEDFRLKDTLTWRPRHPDVRATELDLTFRIPERYRIASAGALMNDAVQDKTRIVRWSTGTPVRSMAFHYGRLERHTVEEATSPRLAIYANRHHQGFAPGNREKTIADLTDSIALFTDYFGPFPFPSLLLTETPTRHGQAFPGLVLLTYQTFGELYTGEAELFRAHEVAHQWWGAGINWEGYRDQWMSEGFAHYAAALYALKGLDKPEQFENMINAWRLDVLGEGQVGQGLGLKHYGYSPQLLVDSDGHDSGALVMGYRLNSSETPFDYRILVYEKGAYILHMLRSMLIDHETGDDNRFRTLMRQFATDHVGGMMTTRSFELAVEQTFGEPMGWFFDQWVYGVEVPPYRVELDVSPLVDHASPFMLHGRVRQENVSTGFKMPVPVRLTFDDRPALTHQIWIDANEVHVEIPLPARPQRIEFNAGHAVLAKIRD